MLNTTSIEAFSIAQQLEGLSETSLQSIMDNKSGYTIETAKKFLMFQRRIDQELLKHSIITNNVYTRWFEKGEMNKRQIQDFVVQFSVFSNLFLIAQLKKTINADTIEGMRASKEILANEIGVIFKKINKQDVEGQNDAELISSEGSVEGGTFRFRAAHFEWLLRMATQIDLGFNDIGKRSHGTRSTLFYCDELSRLYGSEDYMVSQAASYAVENWAAAGFWEELITGFTRYNENTQSNLNLSFFIWHAKIEAQHAAHTQEELEELYFSREIDEDKFIDDGNEMLAGVAEFWNGLDEQRRH